MQGSPVQRKDSQGWPLMAWAEQFTCDGCGVAKKQVNHWFLIGNGINDGFWILPWSEALQIKEYRHVCGHQCAHKLLDEFLQKAQSQ
jgi:hypothetical protein